MAGRTTVHRVREYCPQVPYSGRQWERVHRWTRDHRSLIWVKGLEYAAAIARRHPGKFPQRLRDNGWDPLIGACPTQEQIEASLRMQGLWKNRRKTNRTKVDQELAEAVREPP